MYLVFNILQRALSVMSIIKETRKLTGKKEFWA